jgi:hypothetical protein
MADRPGWLEAIEADIADLPVRTRDRRGIVNDHEVDFLPGAYSAIKAAAKRRRLSIPAFIRRAAYAVAAMDLDIPVGELLARDPRCTRDTGLRVDDPQGIRFGSWEVRRVE